MSCDFVLAEFSQAPPLCSIDRASYQWLHVRVPYGRSVSEFLSLRLSPCGPPGTLGQRLWMLSWCVPHMDYDQGTEYAVCAHIVK